MLIVVCPEEGIVQQLGSLDSFQKEKTKRYWPKQVNIFTRFVCFVLFFTATVLISGHLSDKISACFISFCANITKNVKKKGKLKGNLYQTSEKCTLVLVIGQKRERSGIKIRLLRLVSHSLGDVFKVPHAWSTVFSTFPFEKVSSNLECGALDLF